MSGRTRYQMREKLISIGDDYWIENDEGDKVFKVDGKALRIRDTLEIKDRHGDVLVQIKEQLVAIRDTMNIEDADGEQIAKVKKALISPFRDRFSVEIEDGEDLDIKGNILDYEYKISEGRHKIAEVSKKWFRVRDTYGVEIEPGHDDALILAITVCLDQIAHE